MIRKLAFASTFAMMFVVAAPSFADTAQTNTNSTQQTVTNGKDNQHHRCSSMKHMTCLLNNLKLDSTQQAKIKDLEKQTHDKMKANWEQLKSINSQIKPLVTADHLDQQKLDSLAQQKATVLANMMKTRIMLRQQIYALLTPEQKKVFQATMTQAHEGKMNHKCQCH